jgi:hypothetical protein
VTLRRSILLAVLLSAPALVALAQPSSPFGWDESAEENMSLEPATRGLRRAESVGSSSVTFRLDLGPDLDVAYRPRTRTHPRGYLAEIAAYRIARALGMDNVPPAVGRTIPRPTIESRFVSEAEEDWPAIRQEILWEAPGVARGSAIYWVPRLRRSEVDGAAGLSRAAPWLAIGGEAPVGRELVARDLSTMLAFDYLIGNWDRWSGGNVSENEEGTRLIVRDHNLAFLVPVLDERYTRMREALERAPRFSRSFVARLSALDEAALRAALAQDPEASEERPVLMPAQIDGVLQRRSALLSYIGALIAVHGADRVLAWP